MMALLLGLLVVPGYVVAPILFAQAESPTLAGFFAGHIFHASNLGILLLAGGIAVIWLARRQTRPAWWMLLGAIAVLTALNEFWIAPVIADLKAAMGSVEAVAAEHPLRRSFGMWHGASSLLHLASSMVAVWLLIFHDRHPGGAACSP